MTELQRIMHVCEGFYPEPHYGSMFLINYQRYYEELEAATGYTEQMHAFYSAAVDTGSLMVMNLAVGQACRFFGWAGQKLNAAGWTKASRVSQAISHYGRYSIFAYNATQNDMASMATSLVIGTAAESAVEAAGTKAISYLSKPSL